MVLAAARVRHHTHARLLALLPATLILASGRLRVVALLRWRRGCVGVHTGRMAETTEVPTLVSVAVGKGRLAHVALPCTQKLHGLSPHLGLALLLLNRSSD